MEDKGVLGEFCAEIYKEESFDGCFKIFEKYVKKLGFDGAQKEIDLIKLAREKHGITNAISIPTLVTDLVLSGASFVSSKTYCYKIISR